MLRPTISAMILGCFLLGAGFARGDEEAGRPVLYKLAKGSTYQEGCFEPCACPITPEAPMRGTFWLTYLSFDGLFTHYAVDRVRWWVDFGWAGRRLAGSGSYRVGGEFALQHQLELDLSIDGVPRDAFDSGLVVGGYGFPKIDATVSMHDMFCYDIVLRVRARPVGDIDQNGVVDAADAAVFAQCFSGPGESPAIATPWTAEDCTEAFDVDGDDDVDLVDFAAFALAFRGPA